MSTALLDSIPEDVSGCISNLFDYYGLQSPYRTREISRHELKIVQEISLRAGSCLNLPGSIASVIPNRLLRPIPQIDLHPANSITCARPVIQPMQWLLNFSRTTKTTLIRRSATEDLNIVIAQAAAA